MGISIQQYRAAIGSWNAKELILNEPGIDLLDIGQTCVDQNQEHFKVNTGSWKMNTLLIFLFATMSIMYHVPFTSLNTHTPLLEYITNSSNTHFAIDSFNCSSISAQCHELLLMISGIESNPGPTQEDIIAQLCADAVDVTVRDCLRKYDPKNTTDLHKKELGKCKKPVLVETLAYLGIPDQDHETKPACINNLICRIQNLLPDTCNICDTEYCVGLNDSPLLECEICGQGSHNTCILSQFEIQDELNFGPLDALNKLNPFRLPGIHYLCGACEESTIPKKESGLLKRKSVNNLEYGDALTASQLLHNRSDEKDEDEEENLQNNPPPADKTSETTSKYVTFDTHAQENSQDETHSKDGSTTQEQKSKNDSKKVCRYYQKGICRHGISGKGCPHDHPKQCSKLLKHGNKGPHGCTLGKAKCDRFHPKMCHSSLTKGVCLTSNCNLRHVSGTQMPLKDTTDQPSSGSKQTEKSSTVNANSRTASEENKSTDFLDSLRLLKIELMEAMDVKLATLLSTQTATHSSPAPQPQPVMPPRMMGNQAADRSYPMMFPYPPMQMYPSPMLHMTHIANPAQNVVPLGYPPMQQAASPGC